MSTSPAGDMHASLRESTGAAAKPPRLAATTRRRYGCAHGRAARQRVCAAFGADETRVKAQHASPCDGALRQQCRTKGVATPHLSHPAVEALLTARHRLARRGAADRSPREDFTRRAAHE
eukprot:5112432-Prymnesium_polylepis.2